MLTKVDGGYYAPFKEMYCFANVGQSLDSTDVPALVPCNASTDFK